MDYKFRNKNGITLIVLVVTIIILLILAAVSIIALNGDNGLLTKVSKAKIMTALGTIKEEIELDRTSNLMDNKNVTVEQLLADGKIKRTIQAEGENYYMYYAIKPEVYKGMQGMGKGVPATLKDVFLIDDEFHVKYIDKNGKQYGDDIEEKILEDETEVRFASKEFSEYVSRISGVEETEMKFRWMKNQTNLTIADKSVDSLEDLVFFPNLTSLTLGDWGKNSPQVNTLNGVENCTKLQSITILDGPDKDYMAVLLLSNLKTFYKSGGNDFNNIIDALKLCSSLENVSISNNQISNMSRISELGDLKSLNLATNQITKIEGLENKLNLTALNLESNKITKIEGLENLSNLEGLGLWNNQIIDITPLSVNNSLMSLNLMANPEIDGDRSHYTGEKLEALNEIGKILDRGGTIKINADKLGLFKNYQKLDLPFQYLTTLNPLKGLTELTFLNLSYSNLTLEDEESQEILRSMSKLEDLNLSSNKITKATILNELKNLKILNLLGMENHINLTEIQDIISNLSSLKVSTECFKTIINCDVNKITKISLYGSGLTEIPDLSKFTKLIGLQLSDNSNITNWNILSKLSSLQELRLSGNNLHEKMIDFSNLNNLTYLDLSRNTLWTEDLEKLKVLKNNKDLTIDLSNNSIIDASALVVLDQSCKINLSNNVNLTQESRDTLKARFGSNVWF